MDNLFRKADRTKDFDMKAGGAVLCVDLDCELTCAGHHQGPDEDKGWGRSNGWNNCKDGNEEQGDEEQNSSDHSREAGSSSFLGQK